jgi:hypothetical protein
MAVVCSEGGGVAVDSLRKRMAATHSVAGVEAVTCSRAGNEAAACSRAGIEDGKWWWRDSFLGSSRARESAGTKN